LAAFTLLSGISAADPFNIIAVLVSRLDGFVFCDPSGGIDGQEGVGPGRIGSVDAVCGRVCVLACGAVVLAVGGG
jgi:hypothetical protein